MKSDKKQNDNGLLAGCFFIKARLLLIMNRFNLVQKVLF